MAGATNRQMKRAGFKSAGIQKIRNGHGGALSIRSAMRVADRVNVVRNAQKAASRASSLAADARSAGDRTKAAQLQEKANALHKRADDARARAKKFDTVGMSYERASRLRRPGK